MASVAGSNIYIENPKKFFGNRIYNLKIWENSGKISFERRGRYALSIFIQEFQFISG